MRKCEKRGQISTEYLIVLGFIAFMIMSILGVAFFYMNSARDQIKSSQITSFANKILSNSRSVFYAGEPSQVVINAYLPDGVEDIWVFEEAGAEDILVFNVSNEGGGSVTGFSSDVNLNIVSLSISEGVKRIRISAFDDEVRIEEIG